MEIVIGVVAFVLGYIYACVVHRADIVAGDAVRQVRQHGRIVHAGPAFKDYTEPHG